jgi:glutathione synthase/RimK-type ligase-like ATP-grasp enzyme
LHSVLLVAPSDDVHAQVVADRIGDRAQVRLIDMNAAVSGDLEIVPGKYVILDGKVVAESGTTVWWRRTGNVPPAKTGNAENRLRAEEARAQVIGGLMSLDVRWVDHPGTVNVAEHTLVQLSEARRAGARTPDTVATNIKGVARQRLAQGRQVAKSISSGVGIAPYADDLDDDLIDLIQNAPTVLQEHIDGTADLRVVVVGDQAFTWRRPKTPVEPFDWRRPDPGGQQFESTADPGIGKLAIDITRRLGLTFSAQDWVETHNGHVFLETNPVGQWLFLTRADRLVGHALADHLLTSERP